MTWFLGYFLVEKCEFLTGSILAIKWLNILTGQPGYAVEGCGNILMTWITRYIQIPCFDGTYPLVI